MAQQPFWTCPVRATGDDLSSGVGAHTRPGRFDHKRARSRSRSSFRRILPEVVSGSSSTNSISRGTSYAARRSRTSAFSSAASASDGDARDDERLDRLGPHLVRDPDHRRQRDRRVADEALLDLASRTSDLAGVTPNSKTWRCLELPWPRSLKASRARVGLFSSAAGAFDIG